MNGFFYDMVYQNKCILIVLQYWLLNHIGIILNTPLNNNKTTKY